MPRARSLLDVTDSPEGPSGFWSKVRAALKAIAIYFLLPVAAIVVADGIVHKKWYQVAVPVLVIAIGLIGLGLVGYYKQGRSWFVWFIAWRIWVDFFSLVGAIYCGARIYIYFGSSGSSNLTSKSWDPLVLLGGLYFFAWGAFRGYSRIRPATGRRQALDAAFADVSMSYEGPTQNYPFADRGNHLFRLDFSVSQLVELDVFLIVVERDPALTREDEPRNVCWTSLRMRPIRPLGISDSANPACRFPSWLRGSRCIVRDGRALWIHIYYGPNESWRDRSRRLWRRRGRTVCASAPIDQAIPAPLGDPERFRATVYFTRHGFVQASVSAVSLNTNND